MPPKPTSRASAARVRELRRRMDRLNLVLLALIEKRVRLALRIGRAKRALDLPAVDSERERAMLAQLLVGTTDATTRADLERAFRAIFAASRNAVVRDRRGRASRASSTVR